MTATSPDNGPGMRARRIARGAVALVIALGSWGTAPAAATTHAPDPDPASVSLIVSVGVRGVVASGAQAQAEITVDNDATTPLSAGSVLIEVGTSPFESNARLGAWLDSAETSTEFAEVASTTTAAVPADSASASNILLTAKVLKTLDPGVYPLRATLNGATNSELSDDDTITARNVVIVSASPLPSAVVMVPITSTPADGVLLTAEELGSLTAPDGALTEQLDGVTGTSAVLAIDPSIATAIRVLGSNAPASATEWLQKLNDLPNERFALQFGDADLAVQAQAGLQTSVQPLGLESFFDADGFSPDPVVPPTNASPEPQPTATKDDAVPDDETLRAVRGAIPGIVWPRTDVSAENLASFDAYLGTETTTVLSSATLDGESGSYAKLGSRRVLVSSSSASAAFSLAAGESNPARRQSLLAIANGRLALSGRATKAPLLLGLNRDETRPAEALRETVLSVDDPAATLSALQTTHPASATLITRPNPARGEALRGMLEEESTLVPFSTILDDPQVLLAPTRIRLLRSIGVGLSDSQFEDSIRAMRSSIMSTLDAVDIAPSSTIQLLSANADLPFAVRNDLPWPVNIRLTTAPSDARLDVRSVVAAQIPARTTSRVKVPVSARVGSGEVDLRLSLHSPTAVPIGSGATVRVAVRAEWETIGLAVFGGLIVTLLGLGIFRTLRRRRREAGHETETA